MKKVKNMIKEKIFGFVQRSLENEKNFFYSPIRALLWFFSYFFKTAVYLKNFLYDKRFLKPKKVKPFVISIGNIVAGGAGKTPFTIYLAAYFLKKQKKVAIVSRGYGGKIGDQNIVLCKKENKIFSPEIVGDEPALISNRLCDAYVIVGKNKVRSAEIAEKLHADVVIVDDGFQHRRLHRDLDLVIVDDQKTSNPHFLPRGYLRDFFKRLERTDLVIVSNCIEPRIFDSSRLYTKPNFSCIKDLRGNQKEFFQKKIGVFCAIARPNFFMELLKSLGYEIVLEHFGIDHAHFSEDLLKNLANQAKEKGAEGLICTEKDFIKLSFLNTIIPIYYLEIDIKIVSGEDKLIKLVNEI